jgi:2'-5' RNA ligase
MTLRLFVALEPPGAVRRRVESVAAEIRRLAGRAADEVKWVRGENLHLTLQFLGNVPEARLPDLAAALGEAARASRPLHLEVRGAGGFPNARRPRVVWAGLEGDLGPLADLVRDLGQRLAPLGFPPEDRPWSPHLTLGRARGGGAAGLAGALSAVREAEGGGWRASELLLFRSQLSPDGPRYDVIQRIYLGHSAD